MMLGLSVGRGQNTHYQKRSESEKPAGIGEQSEPGKYGGRNLSTNIGSGIERWRELFRGEVVEKGV